MNAEQSANQAREAQQELHGLPSVTQRKAGEMKSNLAFALVHQANGS